MKKIYILSFLLSIFVLSCQNNRSKSVSKESVIDNNKNQKAESIDDRGYIVKEGDKAPEFSLMLTDGRKFKLSDFKGKVVMLQFTASWCSVCRREMPYIESEIWQKHKSNSKFVLIGIDREETIETVRQFIEQTKITYPIALDTNAEVFGLYADLKAGITRNVIINEEGTIVKLTRLFNEEEFNSMCTLINQMLE